MRRTLLPIQVSAFLLLSLVAGPLAPTPAQAGLVARAARAKQARSARLEKAGLPHDYYQRSGAGKLTALWNQVKSTEYQRGEQPGLGHSKWRVAVHTVRKLMPWNLVTNFTHREDIMPPGSPNEADKIVHRDGVEFTVDVTVGGITKSGLARLSFAIPTKAGPDRNIVPGIALKFPQDGETESWNVLAMDTALGQGNDGNPFARTHRTKFPRPRLKDSIPVWVMGQFFALIRRDPNTLTLPPALLAGFDLPASTELLELHYTEAARELVPSDVDNPRTALADALQPGIRLAELSFDGVQSGHVDVTSRGVSSKFGSRQLFFAHQGWDTRIARLFARILGYGKPQAENGAAASAI